MSVHALSLRALESLFHTSFVHAWKRIKSEVQASRNFVKAVHQITEGDIGKDAMRTLLRGALRDYAERIKYDTIDPNDGDL